MRKRILIAVAAMVVWSAAAPAADLPPGRWWRNMQVAERLALTPDQQTRLDAVFHDAATDLIDRRADIEKLSLALRTELDQAQLNRQNLQRAAAQLTAARGRLFEREVMMLADMRGVLNDHQWQQLRQQMERRQQIERRPAMDPRRQQRPPRRP